MHGLKHQPNNEERDNRGNGPLKHQPDVKERVNRGNRPLKHQPDVKERDNRGNGPLKHQPDVKERVNRGNGPSTHPGHDVQGLHHQPDVDGGQKHGRTEDDPRSVDQTVDTQVDNFVLAFRWIPDIRHSAQYDSHEESEDRAYVDGPKKQLPDDLLNLPPERRSQYGKGQNWRGG